jgi:hypothetical protein
MTPPRVRIILPPGLWALYIGLLVNSVCKYFSICSAMTDDKLHAQFENSAMLLLQLPQLLNLHEYTDLDSSCRLAEEERAQTNEDTNLEDVTIHFDNCYCSNDVATEMETDVTQCGGLPLLATITLTQPLATGVALPNPSRTNDHYDHSHLWSTWHNHTQRETQSMRDPEASPAQTNEDVLQTILELLKDVEVEIDTNLTNPIVCAKLRKHLHAKARRAGIPTSDCALPKTEVAMLYAMQAQYSLSSAALKVGINTATFKRSCRAYNISRWLHRRLTNDRRWKRLVAMFL